MISPHKYLDLNLSVINLGGVILNVLLEQELIKYDELLERVLFSNGESAKEVFVPTLSFLYTIGKIEYRQEIDSIELKR
ncbi:MAG: hypothetical protein KF846_10640 [Cyclobacteriaceae bacterium]|nr:hypothetical protein [Cyclobacteriaceae bacterium]